MKTHGWMMVSILAGLTFVGCGGNGTSQIGGREGEAGVTGVRANGTGASPAEPDIADVPEPPIDAIASPEEVVTFFLESLQAGNTPHVAGILTKKARLEMDRLGFVVNADGLLPGTKYEIGDVEYIGKNKDGVHVETNWTANPGSELKNFQVVWVLRKQEQGWRIAGMASDVPGRETKEFINFENPRETFDSPEAVETASKKGETRRSK